MKYKRIYTLFSEKIENGENENNGFNVIISFEDVSKRDKFIKKNKKLQILDKFTFLPSVVMNLNKDQITKFEKENLIKQIEENQRLYQSMLDVGEILGINNYKDSQISYTGKNVNVGIIDDGINKNYASISKNQIKQYSFNQKAEDNKPKKIEAGITHGTLMASIISNQFRNIDNNYIGIAPNVNFIDFNIYRAEKKYYFSDCLQVFDKIIEEDINVDILLISLNTKESSDGKDILSQACNILVEKGIISICPAGNFGPDPFTIGSPAAAQKNITVGALLKNLSMTNFSGRGPTLDERIKPDIVLIGSDVLVPLSKDLRVKVSGTSVSASICVGFIALLKEFDPEMSYKDIFRLIKRASRDMNYDSKAQGVGILRITDLFKELGLYHEKLSSYNYLTKRSLILSIEFLIVFILIFYFVFFFNSWRI